MLKKNFEQILSICKSFSLLIRTSKMKKPIQSWNKIIKSDTKLVNGPIFSLGKSFAY